MKKVVRYISLISLSVYSFVCLITAFKLIKSFIGKYNGTKLILYGSGKDHSFFNVIKDANVLGTFYNCLFVIFSLAVVAYALYKLIRCTFFKELSYPIKYTYEEYKEMRDKRKAEKQERKKQKLQQQLNNLENTD